jgi:nitroimidazol reductase NimA-like FMN-containing flavoprotein (pyridoxamine 5'-phosphate oxidase superfamily)
MYIHEMTDDECRSTLQTLQKATVGRIACARDSQPYIVPINFAFDGEYIYGFTTLGQNVEWMRLNPLVCFEVDEVVNSSRWTSVIVFGRYEELPNEPGYELARAKAHAFLQKRAMWWEPAYISPECRDQSHSLTPIFFRIHIERMTGHHATPDKGKVSNPIQALPVKRGWLAKLFDP